VTAVTDSKHQIYLRLIYATSHSKVVASSLSER